MVDEADTIRVINAQLRYYFNIPDPDELSDEKWAALYAELEFVRTLEAKRNNEQYS